MVVCGFCSSTLFNRPDWLPDRDDVIDHHTSYAEWTKSIDEACVICTLLLEHVEEAIAKSLDAGNPALKNIITIRQDLDNHDPRLDVKIRGTSVEKLLLEWLASVDDRYLPELPLYQVKLQDFGARNGWRLRFQAVSRGGTTLRTLPVQKFMVYEGRYDGSATDQINLSDDIDSKATISQYQSWIEQCQSHQDCRYLHRERTEKDYVPKRLLDVGSLEIPSLQVIETQKADWKKYRRYVTLSYKWGPPALQTCLLKEENRARYLKQIPEHELTVTFRDAVAVTRKLGLQYLWIDALCILQYDAQEWLEESPFMQEVYGSSYLSLAAVSADNCAQGLFRKRIPDAAQSSVVRVNWAYQTLMCRIVREDFWEGELLSQPLYKRGWVLQERMLAPRILHFNRRQVFWQCPSLTASESLPSGLSNMLNDERRDELRWRQLVHRANTSYTTEQEAEMHGIWRHVVESYTTCALTKSSDMLMAISGIAKRMQQAYHGEKYIAGHWERRLVDQLAWRVIKSKPLTKDSSTWRAPSWAWPSANGVVTIPARLRIPQSYVMAIRPNGLHLVLENPESKLDVGTLSFASLTAEAQLYDLQFRVPAKPDSLECAWQSPGEESRHAWCRLFLDSPLPAEDRPVQVSCTAAMLFYHTEGWSNDAKTATFTGSAIALHAVDSASRLYTRFGLINFRNLGGPAWVAFQRARRPKSGRKGDDGLAPSDNRGEFSHIITLL